MRIPSTRLPASVALARTSVAKLALPRTFHLRLSKRNRGWLFPIVVALATMLGHCLRGVLALRP